MKTCKNPKCTEVNPQPLDNFYNEKGMKDGKRSECKTCRNAKIYAERKRNPRAYNGYTARWRALNPDRQHATDIKRNYGLPIEEYNRLLTEQECKCKICGRQHDPSIKRGRLYVDHCHKGPKARSGEKAKVRGLLCSACNSAIGYFEDNIETLQKAIEYLKTNGKI
jgi:hypothetical protein